MNPGDTTTFQNSVQLARAGQVSIAYHQFCTLAKKSENRNNPDLLLWIATTTPSSQEAQRALYEVTRIAPHHPGLPQVQAQLAQRAQPAYSMNMHMHLFPQIGAYRCPFCGTSVEPVIVNKISTAGWIIF